MKKAFISCLIVIGGVAFVMGALSIWLQSEAGIAFATNKGEEIVRKATGLDVEIQRLRLTLPLKMNIRAVRVKDGGETRVSASSLRVDVAALPLLFKHLKISKFQASEVTLVSSPVNSFHLGEQIRSLHRKDAAPSETNLRERSLGLPKLEGRDEEWSWPNLPWAFGVNRLAIDRLSIDGVVLEAKGKARLGNDLSAHLDLQFIDPELGGYRVNVKGNKRSEEIHLQLIKKGGSALLATGGILVQTFDIKCFGKIDSWGAVLSGKGGRPEQQLLGDLVATVTTSPKSDPIAAKLVGEEATLAGVFSIDGTRTLRLNPIRGQGEGLAIEGKLIANLNGTINQGTLTVTLPDLTLIDGLFGLTYTGALEGTLELAGTFANPSITSKLKGEGLSIEGRTVEQLRGEVVWQRGSGTASLQAEVARLPLALTTSITHDEAIWALPDMGLRAPDSHVTGSLVLTNEGLSSFDLEGKIEELWTWAPLLQLDVEGSLTFKAEYANETLMASMRALTFNYQKLALEEAHIKADLLTPFSSPHGELTAIAGRASYNRITAQKTTFSSTLGGEAWPFSLEWEGEEEVAGSAAGQWHATSQRFWSHWETFGGMILDEEIALMEPITVEKLKGEEVTFTPLKLRAGGGTLSLAYNGKELSLDMENFPLQAVELLLPGLGLVGKANATINLKNFDKGAEGQVAITVAGVELKESPVTDLGTVFGSFNATLKGGRLDATLTADSTRSSPLKTTVSLPFALTSRPLNLNIPSDGTISGSGRFVGELGPLIQFFLPYNMRLLGDVDARVDIGGTAGDPELKGTMTLKRGLLEDAYSGAELTDIDALFKAKGPHITLQKMSARAGGGTATATGTLDIIPSKNYPLQLDGKLERAQVAALTVAQVSVSGDLILSGPFLSPTFSGHLVTDRARIAIPKRFSPTGVPKLEVTYINLPPSKREIIRKTQPVSIGLDLTLEVPDNLRVRGRGVRATLGGKLDIEGTVERPNLKGNLSLVKGEFTFGSKCFTLTSGTIAFDGPPEDNTRIDVSGSIQVSDVEVGVTISGPIPNLKLSLFSNPPMADREILSYLLFDSPASLIGAGQALQLAAASNEVAGGNFGPGLLASLPKKVGLDGLTISSPAGNSEELGIQATKRISPDFDINIYRSINSASNHLIIEFNFFKAFSFRAERVVETDDEPGADRLSLRWRHDY